MQEQDIKGVLKKVEELKALFTFAVRYTPFLEDLLLFVQEMAPMLHEMSKSIEESSSKMPDAVDQLDKVTSATEIATNEMLDKVDEILIKMDDITEGMNNYLERNRKEQEAVKSIASAIEQLMDLPGVKEKMSQVFEDENARNIGMSIKSVVDEFLESKIEDEKGQELLTKVQDAQGDAYDIMNALQVQDITTQQIAAAHGLLRQVQGRLNKLIEDYAGTEPPELIREAKAHDINATLLDADERQNIADSVLKEAEAEAEKNMKESFPDKDDRVDSADETNEDEGEDIGSQADIDALFAANQASATESDEKADEEESPTDTEETSEVEEENLEDEMAEEEAADDSDNDEVYISGDQVLDDADISSVLPGEEDDADLDLDETEDAVDDLAGDVEEKVDSADEALDEVVDDAGEESADEPEQSSEDDSDEKAEEESSEENGISISQEEIDKLFQ